MSKTISERGLALIQDCEGLRLTAYQCSAGVWTIGYGHTGPDVFEGQKITKSQAELLLRRDVARFERCVARSCKESTQSQFDAMVSLAFNIGEANFAGGGKRRPSSVVRLHNEGRYPEAQQAFMAWNKARDAKTGKLRVVNGLTTRRAREADLYDNDDLPTDIDTMPQAVDGEKPLSQSRTITGSAVAITSSLGVAASDQVAALAPQVVEYQNIVTQLIPYFDAAKYVLLALIIVGGIYAICARVCDRDSGRN